MGRRPPAIVSSTRVPATAHASLRRVRPAWSSAAAHGAPLTQPTCIARRSVRAPSSPASSRSKATVSQSMPGSA